MQSRSPNGRVAASDVLIDATAIPRDRKGVGRYVDELVRALDAEGVAIAIACQAHDEAAFRRLAPSATLLPQRGIAARAPRLLWEQLALPAVARRAGSRLIHSPHYTIPLPTRRRRVVTFHDATFFSDPGVHTRFKRRFFPAWMRVSHRLADAVIADSAASAAEFDAYLPPIPGKPYDIVHLGVDLERFRPPTPEAVARARDRLGLPERWIAYLGSIEPRKNVPALVDAYAELAAGWTADPDALPALAIAGADGWDVDLGPSLARVAAPGRVVRLGYIDLDDLPAYLGGAAIVAYPSIAEGFGLPVLEALACGAPVLTTPRLSLPEVAGDAAHYAEPDTRSIAAALRELLADDARRAELARRGPRRAAAFTWAACAAGHVRVWERVLGGPVARRASSVPGRPSTGAGTAERVEGPPS